MEALGRSRAGGAYEARHTHQQYGESQREAKAARAKKPDFASTFDKKMHERRAGQDVESKAVPAWNDN